MYGNNFNKPNIICSFFCYNLKVVRRGLLLTIVGPEMPVSL